jgi:hypothetical protein
MMEAVRTSETSVDNHFTRQYNPEDNSEHHARRRENLKSHTSLPGNISGSRGSEYEVRVFWNVTLCSLVEIDRRFRGA